MRLWTQDAALASCSSPQGCRPSLQCVGLAGWRVEVDWSWHEQESLGALPWCLGVLHQAFHTQRHEFFSRFQSIQRFGVARNQAMPWGYAVRRNQKMFIKQFRRRLKRQKTAKFDEIDLGSCGYESERQPPGLRIFCREAWGQLDGASWTKQWCARQYHSSHIRAFNWKSGAI